MPLEDTAPEYVTEWLEGQDFSDAKSLLDTGTLFWIDRLQKLAAEAVEALEPYRLVVKADLAGKPFNHLFSDVNFVAIPISGKKMALCFLPVSSGLKRLAAEYEVNI